LALREEDFVVSARLVGCSEMRTIFVHMVPAFMSHIIAATTLALPAMIISETALSFLGLGLRPPAISWGVLLQHAQNVQTVAISPWLMLPAVPDRPRRNLVSPASGQRRAGADGESGAARAERPRDARDPRRGDRADLSGADVLVQSGAQRRQPDRRGDPAPPAGQPPRGARQGDRDAATSRRAIAGAARGPAVQSAERRPAPARQDRDGA